MSFRDKRVCGVRRGRNQITVDTGDGQSPRLSQSAPTPAKLPPAITVTVSYGASSTSDPNVSYSLTVGSNETENDTGDGDMVARLGRGGRAPRSAARRARVQSLEVCHQLDPLTLILVG